ncbi:CrcB-like protein-domain-containing protein [Coprinopsis sp. MPI-PUGE-AT-0042]|nr:CrcB-like protein-domain-containing protein [Coprinopsis sp. MPI-PUGE-AT-0042]
MANPRTVAELDQLQEAEETRHAETIDRPPNENEGIGPPKVYRPFDLPVLLILAPASILGLLARLGLQALTSFPGQSAFSLLYVQGLGCFIMGMGLRLKGPLGNYYGPFYTAVTTGFCGSLTTFSGWQLDVFRAWTSETRSGLHNAVDGIGISLITFSISLGSFAFGHNVASFLLPHLRFPPFPPRWQRYSVTLLSALMYASTIIAYFLLSPSHRHKETAALLFSYPGTLTRYTLSVLLNSRFSALPAGTLTANILGTALLATFHLLQSLGNPVSPSACSTLQGLADGYCGCLTTVSTFVAEIRDLGRWKAVRYAVLSWGLGQMAMVLILGSALWSGSAAHQVTCTFQ